MILDSRIKEGKRPLTCLDVEQAREFVGKLCLFSDAYANYKNVQEYTKHHPKRTGILNFEMAEPLVNGDLVFRNANEGVCYSLVLPLEWIDQGPGNKINFEPYHLETFKKEFNIGDVVTFKGKTNTDRVGSYYKCIYSGYRIFAEKGSTNIIVNLGLWGFTFSELFDFYEINRDENWEPFGRKVETIDLNKCN